MTRKGSSVPQCDEMFSQRTNWDLKTNRFTATLERLQREKRPLLDLTASNPTTCGLGYDERLVLEPLAETAGMRYSPEARGLRSAREAVASYYAELPKPAEVHAEDVFLTTSTSEGYSYAFRLLCDPGDEVLIPRPGYPLFDLLATIQDVKLVHYPLLYDHGWQIDPYALEAAVTPRTRAVVMVHPNNPTGSFASGGEREWLSELCARREMGLIVDEVFLDYSFGVPGRSFADNDVCLTMTLSGLSKVCGLPQMKVAWMAVNGPAAVKGTATERLEIIADTYLSLNTLMQAALPKLLASRTGFQEQLRARLAENLRVLDARLASAPQIQRMEVQGGWYATLRVPAVQSDEDLAVRLMEQQGVVVHPGHFFDFAGEGYLVVSLMTPEVEFQDGIGRVIGS